MWRFSLLRGCHIDICLSEIFIFLMKSVYIFFQYFGYNMSLKHGALIILGVSCCNVLYRSQSTSFPSSSSQVTTSAAAATSLLDFEDLLGLNTYEVSTPAPSSLNLKTKPSLVAQAFQRKWGQLAVASTLVRYCISLMCALTKRNLAYRAFS